MAVIGWIFFGAFVGWLSSWIMGRRSGCILNIALGLVGALAGGFIFQVLTGGNFSYENSGGIVSTLVAVIGAVIVIAVYNAITRDR